MRRATAILAPLAAMVALAGAAGYPVYVRPQIDTVRKADAILVLGGTSAGARYRYGLDLARQGWAPNLVLSNPYGAEDRDTAELVTKICQTPQPGLNIVCFDPDPRTTLGEGAQLRRLADENHWETVIVVTFVPHVSRARYIIGKCFDGELVMVASPTHLGPVGWTWMYIYQTAGYIKAALQTDC
jgi:uncharacterized SAM-binding protein YcdF (DUF218 family)